MATRIVSLRDDTNADWIKNTLGGRATTKDLAAHDKLRKLEKARKLRDKAKSPTGGSGN